MQTKASSLISSICEARDELIAVLTAHVRSVVSFTDELHVHDKDFCEKALMSKMRIDAKSYADKQKVIEKTVGQLEHLFDALGQSFQKDSRQERDDAETAVGCIVYLIALYTAVTLYRSRMLGQKNGGRRHDIG